MEIKVLDKFFSMVEVYPQFAGIRIEIVGLSIYQQDMRSTGGASQHRGERNINAAYECAPERGVSR
jgi:hypothetical protein